jgi:hypothetical protein
MSDILDIYYKATRTLIDYSLMSKRVSVCPFPSHLFIDTIKNPGRYRTPPTQRVYGAVFDTAVQEFNSYLVEECKRPYSSLPTSIDRYTAEYLLTDVLSNYNL